MPFDAIVALLVLAILFAILFGVIWWARGAPAYDDGRTSSLVTYVEEPDDPRRAPGAPDPVPDEAGEAGTPAGTGGPAPDAAPAGAKPPQD